ncbi:DUF4007 family protein [Lysinibacillus capsici]|uniref:DUF4007 family protein n=1 Tax=Lysinibacillus capsici TaxID=2115968 RepID=UPI002731C3AC|nr:DUF4007 family protein [Lysinibacillus capsici]MDP1394445.1 DUF4007 family protein [Lysinibacillus capsici]MDP1414885.1 DUF4007 family protein [Lysinibacillus capsici]MDP1430779.1 DUF4007 family protein [Lysinibacillus capsici]
MAFGQHQTFYVRQHWINKGLREVRGDGRFFYRDDHFEVLGVGKNMAKAIRHWLTAMQLVEDVRGLQTEVLLTELANIVMQFDPYIKSKQTLSLLHYLLVTEEDTSTTWYWFFNVFNERVFNKTMLVEQLSKWTSENYPRAVSETTIKRDIDCLVQLYALKEYHNQTPEDVIKSPFEVLGLIQGTAGTNYLKASVNFKQNTGVLYVTLLKYCDKHAITEVSLTDLQNAEELWGCVFNLNRDAIINYIDEIQQKYPIKFTRTNRLDVVRLEQNVHWLNALRQVYENEVLA